MALNLFGGGSSPFDIEIELSDIGSRSTYCDRPTQQDIDAETYRSHSHTPSHSPKGKVQPNDSHRPIFIFGDNEQINGIVKVKLNDTSKHIDHLGLSIELIGRIESEIESSPFEFLSFVHTLSGGGTITSTNIFPFSFASSTKPFESYYGKTVQVRYVLRARLSLNKTFTNEMIGTRDIFIVKYGSMVQGMAQSSTTNSPMKAEIGIQDAMHLEVHYQQKYYHLNDVIRGFVKINLMRIKIHEMELHIIRKEQTTAGDRSNVASQTIARFELMDGAPAKGDIIPIRMYLSPYPLSPSYISHERRRMSVRYYLSLSLYDEDERRYFKQHEIFLYRGRTTQTDRETVPPIAPASYSSASYGDQKENTHTRHQIDRDNGSDLTNSAPHHKSLYPHSERSDTHDAPFIG